MTACAVVLAYTSLLHRPPEPAGQAYWATATAEDLIDGIANSPEAATTGTLWLTQPDGLQTLTSAIQAVCGVPHPEGWLDLGNGVYGPPVLSNIRWCESRDDYQAANPRSSARGAWQALTGTWQWVTNWLGGDWPPTADLATPAQQDRFAVALATEIPGGGLSHWSPSKGCWG